MLDHAKACKLEDTAMYPFATAPKLVLLIVPFFLVIASIFFVPSTQAQSTGKIWVMTFNYDGGAYPTPEGMQRCNPSSVQHTRDKATNFARYIRALHDQGKSMDVILLQEMYCGAEGSSDSETEFFKQALADVGLPMDYAQPPYSLRAGHPHVVTFVRQGLTLHRDEQVNIPLNGKAFYGGGGDDDELKRWSMAIPVSTPLGKIMFYNIHSRIQESEAGFHSRFLFDKARKDSYDKLIIGGDFNCEMDWDQCDVRWGPGEGKYDDFFINHTERSLDFIFIYKASGLTFGSTTRDFGATTNFGGYLRSDHIPVYSEVIGPLDPNFSTPTPQPTPTPVPLVKNCSVQLSNSSVVAETPVTVHLQATTSRTENEAVRVYINRADNGKINPPPAGTTEAVFSDRHYYGMTPEPCTTSSSSNCDKTFQISGIPAGYYRVYCDVSQEPNACTGNPNCDFNGGTIDCAALGFNSCSNNDMATLSVSKKPGDVTGDGKIDIFDYNKIIEYFGRDKCEYNLVETCLIDIFDFNQVTQNFDQ